MRRFILLLLFILLGTSIIFSQGKIWIALIPFTAMGVSETEAATASMLLETALVQTNTFMVIEQNQVGKIMEAQSFTLSGNTDELYATEIGKLLSAEQIIIGSFSHVGTEYIINAKIIDIKLGQNIRAEKVLFTNIDELTDSTIILASKLAAQTIIKEENSTNTSIIEKQDPDISMNKASKYIFQLSLGSAYSSYFYDMNTVLDSMDEGTLSRIPLSIDLLFGKKISNKIAWTISLNSGIDSFSSSSNSFQIYTVMLAAGYQYIPFQTGLFMGLNFGVNMLIPNTTLNYIGGMEFGSSISFDIGYFFEKLKFSNAGIIPGLGLKLVHSEMKRGSVDQICGYINLGIR